VKTRTALEIADTMPEWMVCRVLRGEKAIEVSEFRQRDEIISTGVARRAWPKETGGSWQTWMTPLGLEVREILAEREEARAALASTDGTPK
jgi:hypothetical protein